MSRSAPYIARRQSDRPYTIMNANVRRRDVWKRRAEGAAIGLLSVVIGIGIARLAVEPAPPAGPIATVDADDGECWDQLPMRKAITQQNLDRLCVKPLPRYAVPAGASAHTPTTPKR